MTNEELVELINSDLKNELLHMKFYLHASSRVQSLFREELREFFTEEAQDEMKHCQQFADMVVYLGGTPVTDGNPLPDIDYTDPQAVLAKTVELENEVAEIYSKRLRQTESHANSNVSRTHVFYEDQIQDSWDTAKEVEQMIARTVAFSQ